VLVYAYCGEEYPVYVLSTPTEDDYMGWTSGYVDLPDDLVREHQEASQRWRETNRAVTDALEKINGRRFK
jgi:hypothetical protein